MGKENYTDIDNEVRTNIDNEVRTNIDNEVMIHPAFIRFVLFRPWLRDADYKKYSLIREESADEMVVW